MLVARKRPRAQRARRVVSLVSVLIASMAWFSASTLAAEANYDFTGDPFTVTPAPYSSGDRLLGGFSIALPLAPDLSLTDVSSLLIDFSFDDGVQVRSKENSVVCEFQVATDASGNLSNWSIALREPVGNTGDPQQFIDLNGLGNQAGVGPRGATQCDNVMPTVLASSPTSGLWTAPGFGVSKVYSYEGNPFETADPPYTTADRLVGSIELTGEISPFTQIDDLAPLLLDFNFSDGIQTRTPANSAVCGASAATDGAGAIISWVFSLREVPAPAPSNPQQAIDFGSVSGDSVGTGPAGTEPCSPFIYSVEAQTLNPGSWFGGMAPAPPVTYSYLGQPFDKVQGVFPLGNRIAGTVQLAGFLPPNLPTTDVIYAVVDFSFTDGVQVRTPATSLICGFEISTDAFGNIATWSLFLRESPFVPGDPQESLLSADPGVQFSDQSTIGPADSSVCGGYVATDFAVSSLPGTWRRQGADGVLSIPTLSPWALGALILLLAVGAVGILRGHSRPWP